MAVADMLATSSPYCEIILCGYDKETAFEWDMFDCFELQVAQLVLLQNVYISF